MKRLLPITLGLLALAGCVKPMTPAQGVYVAYGTYSGALDGAAAYANSPTADAAVVHRLNAISRSAPIQKALEYGKAYTKCQASNATTVPGIDCTKFDFSDKSAAGFATQLRAAATALFSR